MVDVVKSLLTQGSSLFYPTHALGRLVYTVPTSPPTTTILRDITVVNQNRTGAATAAVGIGDTNVLEHRLWQKSIATSSTETLRGLWVMNAGEGLYIQGLNYPEGAYSAANVATGSSAASTTVSTGAWLPVVGVRYVVFVANTKADAPDTITGWTHNGVAVFPESIVSITSGSVAAVNDLRFSAYHLYWTAPTNGVTTATFGGTEATARIIICSLPGAALGATQTPYSNWALQSATANDTAAPGASTSGLSPTFASAMTGGMVIVGQVRSDFAATSTPPTGFTEATDAGITAYYPTTSPWKTTGGSAFTNTWSSSTADLRAAIAVEWAPELSNKNDATSSNGNLVFNITGVEIT